MREEVRSEAAPSVEDYPFSQAIKHGDTLYLSGQAPVDPETGEIVEGDIGVQTRRVMENVGLVLEAAGASFEDVLQATVFLDDVDDFEGFNEAYGEFVDEPYPARCTVGVDIAADFDLEIKIIAAVP